MTEPTVEDGSVSISGVGAPGLAGVSPFGGHLGRVAPGIGWSGGCVGRVGRRPYIRSLKPPRTAWAIVSGKRLFTELTKPDTGQRFLAVQERGEPVEGREEVDGATVREHELAQRDEHEECGGPRGDPGACVWVEHDEVPPVRVGLAAGCAVRACHGLFDI